PGSARRDDLRRHPRQPHPGGAFRDPGDDALHRADRSQPRIRGAGLRCEHRTHVPARPGAAPRTGDPRRVAAGAGAHDRTLRADLPHRGARFADARRRAVLRGVRGRRPCTALGRCDGDDLHGRDARLAVDRVALRQSDAARVPCQRASSTGDMTRLSLAMLGTLPPSIATPAYDPRLIAIGIVHLGIGAFHRAQTAIYTDDALAQVQGPWGICGGSLRSADVRDRLARQDGLYTSVEKSPKGLRRRSSGSVVEVLFLGEDRDRIAARLHAPATDIVSLTVTEKGYCHDPASGRLNFAHPDIVHDLADPARPLSAVGLIVAALDARRRSAAKGFTVLCCHYPPHNGALLRGLVLAFAAERDPALARWIEDHAALPSTMVDRIVPATTDADIADNDRALGLHDAAPVVHEPFKQWVIEDRFVAGRPAWDRVGVQFVADVAPFEAMKLRLLNASHSAFAYLGYLAGHEYIYQVAAQPDFVAFMRRLMKEEVAPT